MSKNGRVNRDFDPEFRSEAGRLVIEQEAGVSETARSLGIHATTLHGWVRRFRIDTWALETDVAMDTPNTQRSLDQGGKLPPSSQKVQDHVKGLEIKKRKLEAKLRRLTMEWDILQKAMAASWTSRSKIRLYSRSSGRI
jgi:transposase